jgi:hypothetical protein
LLAGGAIARVEWASVDTSEIVMLSGRTIARVSVAAPTRCASETLAGAIYPRDIDKLPRSGARIPWPRGCSRRALQPPMMAVRCF